MRKARITAIDRGIPAVIFAALSQGEESKFALQIHSELQRKSSTFCREWWAFQSVKIWPRERVKASSAA